MKLTFAFAAVLALAVSTSAFAGQKNNNGGVKVRNTTISQSAAQSRASANNSGNHQSTTFNDRLQAPGLGSFGGGACEEGIMLSGPGFGVGIQAQCKEYKQRIKFGVVSDAFGREGSRRWLCETDKQLYTLPACRAYRMENARRK